LSVPLFTFILAYFGRIIQSVAITSVAMSGALFYANLSLVFKYSVSLATENYLYEKCVNLLVADKEERVK